MPLATDLLIQKAVTTTTPMAKLIPQLWAAQVEYNLRLTACIQPSVVSNEDLLVPNSGDTVYIPSLPEIAVAGTLTEGTDMTDIALSTATSVPLIPGEVGKSVGITRKALDRMKYDGISLIMDRLSYSMSRKIEGDIFALWNATVPVVGGAMTVLYAQSSATGTITTANVFDDDLILRGLENLETSNNIPFPDGYYRLFISPRQKRQMLQDSNIRNDLRWGHVEKLFAGEIGVYHNCRVIVTNYVPTATENTSVTTYKALLVAPRWAALGWKRRPELVIDPTVYDFGRRRRMAITADYDCQLLHNERGVVLTSA